jgi:hypothetical protein
VDDTGKDVKFFGATSGKYWLWDESADGVVAVSNLQQTGTLTVGVDDTGHDVKLFGATSGKYWLWDESADGVVAVSDLQQTGTLTVGVDDTGHDVKFFGATSGKYMLWDESADSLIVTGVSSFDGKTTINETGADVDFRVESNSQQFALYVNGGLNHVAVGYNAEPTVTNLGIAILSADANGGVLLVKEDGSNPSSGEGLGSFGMRGEDSANNLAASSAMISSYATENHSGSAAGADLRFYTKANGVGPGSAPSERARIDAVGNVYIGGTAARGTTVGTNALQIFNGTAPVGTLSNGCSFYSTSGEMRVMDAAGNATLLSPHDSETNEWIFDSVQTVTGKSLRIDVEKILRFINDKYGLDAILE